MKFFLLDFINSKYFILWIIRRAEIESRICRISELNNDSIKLCLSQENNIQSEFIYYITQINLVHVPKQSSKFSLRNSA